MIPLTYNARSLMQRKTSALVTALGIGLVVFVLATSLMLVEGIKATFSIAGRADTAIVLRKGSEDELTSAIETPHIGLILAAPGVKRDAQGRGLGVAEGVVVVLLQKPGTEYLSNVRVRGVPTQVLDFRPEVRVVRGRPPQPGTDEVMVGQALVGRYADIELGGAFELKKNRPVTVVGVFSAAGSAFESEIWADLDTLRAAFGRPSIVSSVRVRLESPAAFEAFAAAIASEKHLGLNAFSEPAYYEKNAEGTATFIGVMGSVISTLFALGAIIGAMITMYAMVAHRRREIGVLRALGFSRSSVMLSFVLEAVLLAGVGGALGALASLSMGWVEFSMMNFVGWNEVVFRFRPTAGILGIALAFGMGMGLLGGLFPALRAARTPPAFAMRE